MVNDEVLIGTTEYLKQ